MGAAIIAVLQARGYAVLHERRLLPTERGRVLTAFLEHGFGRWMDTGFTAAMEDDLDRIAAGALARRGMLEGFWGPFEAALGEAGGLTRKTVRAAIEDRLDAYLFGPDGAEPRRRRCPACGGDRLELKLSRYGPFVGCADYPDCAYRRSLSAAAAEEDGYAGPRTLGSDPGTGTDVTLRRGPTGWYVQRGERAGKEKPDRMSLPPSLEPDDLDLGLGAPPAGAAPAGRAASGDRRADPRRHRPLRPLGAPRRDLCRDPRGTRTCSPSASTGRSR